MPVPTKLSKKPTRASYARMLAHLTIGLGIGTGAAFVAGPTYGQSCDRCTGLKSPTCSCESESRPGPKQSCCKCVPKLSLGEQLLSHFDKVGDRIEAKTKNPCSGQCDQAERSRYSHCQTCGCEARPFPSDPNRSAIGSIGDKQINAPVPTISRIPIERIPIEQDPPSAWAPESKQPKETNPFTPAESKLPDVLVDPFKDDASFRGTRQKMEGILLTSDRQLSTKVLRFAPSDLVNEEESIPIKPKKPSRLSPITRSGPNLQFEATESASSNGSQVVPSNFIEESMARVIVRKEIPKYNSDEMPQVPRIRVPSKR